MKEDDDVKSVFRFPLLSTPSYIQYTIAAKFPRHVSINSKAPPHITKNFAFILAASTCHINYSLAILVYARVFIMTLI